MVELPGAGPGRPALGRRPGRTMLRTLYSSVPNIPVQKIITRVKFGYKLLFSGTGTIYTDIYQCLPAKNNNFSD